MLREEPRGPIPLPGGTTYTIEIDIDEDEVATVPVGLTWTFLERTFKRHFVFRREVDQRNRFNEVCDWCEENFGPDCIEYPQDADGDPLPGPVKIPMKGIWAVAESDFFFNDDRYATLFKLRWGGETKTS